jgi:hypothetical protein
MNKKNFFLVGFALCICTAGVKAQTETKPVQASLTQDQKAKSDAEQEKKAGEWVASLNLNDAAKEAKVKAAVLTHLKAVRDWHNEHPYMLFQKRFMRT